MELAVEDCLPVGAEGFEEDILDRLVVFVTSIELAAALGLAHVDPVGGAVAGAWEARRLAEGFEQDGTQAVALLPIVGELALQAGEQVGGQRGEANLGQDEIAGVIDDERQVALAGGRVPAHETVARGGFPGGGAAAQQSQQQAVGGVHEVTQLGPGVEFRGLLAVDFQIIPTGD